MLLTKPQKKFLFITSILALLVFLAIFYSIKKKDFLDKKAQQVVKDKTHELYNFQYDSISINEVAGTLYIKNLYLKGDTGMQLKMINNKDSNATTLLFDIYIPQIKVIGFKTASALLSKQLECDEIRITQPQIKLHLFPGQKDENKQSRQELYKQLLGTLKLIKANKIIVENSTVTATDFFTKEVKFKTVNTSINLNGVAIDSTYNQDTSRTFFCKQISITSDKVILGQKKNLAEILNAKFDTRSKILFLSSFSYDAFKNNGFFKSQFSGISLQGIEWKGPVENSELIVDKAVIKKGELETLLNEDNENKTSKKKSAKILTGWIKSFSMNSLVINSINYNSRTIKTKERPVVIKNNSFSIKNIRLNRSSAFNENLITQAEEIACSNDEISIRSADKMYEYKVSGIKLNTKSKNITIQSLKVIPQLKEPEFVKKAHFQTDRYDIKFNAISCKHVNIKKLLRGDIEIEKINTTNASIKVFRDLSYPIDSASKRKQHFTYPHQVIRILGFPLKISKLVCSNSYVEYKEKNALSNNSGKVRLSNACVTIDNISNHKAKTGEKMNIFFKSNFLEKIPLTGHFTFLLDEWQKGTFTAEATMSKDADATLLNELTEPMALMKVERGIIHSVNFYMKADTIESNTTLAIPYDHMRISLLKKKGDHYNKKGIISILANVIVRNNNKEGENMRIAKVVVQKNKYKSFFNFIWMSVFTGIKNIFTLKI